MREQVIVKQKNGQFAWVFQLADFEDVEVSCPHWIVVVFDDFGAVFLRPALSIMMSLRLDKQKHPHILFLP